MTLAVLDRVEKVEKISKALLKIEPKLVMPSNSKLINFNFYFFALNMYKRLTIKFEVF